MGWEIVRVSRYLFHVVDKVAGVIFLNENQFLLMAAMRVCEI